VQGVDNFHEWAAQAIYQGQPQTCQLEEMLKKNRPAVQDAAEIIASFWKSTTGTDLNRDELMRGQFDYNGLDTKLSTGRRNSG
jgi:hypothetical protein